MSTKKLRIFALASVSVLVIAFASVTISFTSSAALATPSRNSDTSPIPPILREVYKVTAGEGDVTEVNIRLSSDQGCKIIRTIKVGTIVAIRSTDSDTTQCENADGQTITLYRLSEDGRRKKGRYIAANNLVKRNAGEAFNENNQAQVSSSNGLNIRGEDCKLLNETDKSIPIALRKGTLVTLPDPDNVKTITCNIPVNRILYTFEMVEVVYKYTKGGQDVQVTGYVAQENLKIPDNTGRKIIIIQ
jgi:ribosomal protein S28E/S33